MTFFRQPKKFFVGNGIIATLQGSETILVVGTRAPGLPAKVLLAAGNTRAAAGSRFRGGGAMNTEKTMEQIMRRAASLVCDPPVLTVDPITQSLRVVPLEECERLLAAHQRLAALDQ